MKISNFECLNYHANKCQNTNNCWHFNIYEHDNLRAHLSLTRKTLYILGLIHDSFVLIVSARQPPSFTYMYMFLLY